MSDRNWSEEYLEKTLVVPRMTGKPPAPRPGSMSSPRAPGAAFGTVEYMREALAWITAHGEIIRWMQVISGSKKPTNLSYAAIRIGASWYTTATDANSVVPMVCSDLVLAMAMVAQGVHEFEIGADWRPIR